MAKSCKALEKKAEKALDKAMGAWSEWYSIIVELGEVNIKEDSCWLEFYFDMKEKSMKKTEFDERAKECADLTVQEEKLRTKRDDAEMRFEKADDVWRKAEDKWKDCIHVKMRLPE